MAMTKNCLRASANARKGGKGSYYQVLGAGEQAAMEGKPASANPYPTGSKNAQIWQDGYELGSDA